MAKQNRGKAIAKLASRGRGTCPVCFTTRTKLLYKRKNEEGVTFSVCKRCVNVSVDHLKQVQPILAPVSFRRKHRKTYHLFVEQTKVNESRT